MDIIKKCFKMDITERFGTELNHLGFPMESLISIKEENTK